MIKRHLTPLIKASLENFPAILLNGARQVGKSTLAKQLVQEGILDHYVTLDDLSTLEAARQDPDGFLHQFQGRTAIDEVQRAPDLLRALKKHIDIQRDPGRFLLTGSANVLSYPGVRESLAGRMDIFPLEGLSLGELFQQKSASTFIHDLFSEHSFSTLSAKLQKKCKQNPPLSRESLTALLFYGGFPEVALKKHSHFRSRWFAAYQTAYIERDIRDLSRIVDIVSFGKLFRLAGFRTANLLNIKNLAVETGIDQRTTNRYLEMLAITFQMHELLPWHINTAKRLTKTSKIYLNDAGFAAHLAGIDSPQHLSNHPMLGAIAETWVWAELRKLLVYLPNIQTGFYRSYSGKEVDFVLCKGQQYCGIEFKWSESVTSKDLSGLRDFQQTLGENTYGILLYTGNQVTVMGNNILAVPLNGLL